MIRRVKIFKSILWFLFGLACALIGVRLFRGLGAVTALSDVTPWGLWKCLNVFAGIAIGAGGFVIAAIAHVFQREKYHPVARMAVLLALCAYSGAGISLWYEIGMPWKIWGPIVYWNVHSPLFEVAWCVMLYLVVLSVEFAPVVLEPLGFQKLYKFVLKLQLPAVILGIMISTLHQSTLGTLFLIMPGRLHAIWYTKLLPELFFVSAIACGLCTVVFMTLFVEWLYHRPYREEMIQGLARYAAMVIAFYAVMRFGDLAIHDKLSLLVDGSQASQLFFLEIFASVLVPLLLFGVGKLRKQIWALWLGSFVAVLGFILNRLNFSGIAMKWATNSSYFPNWTEFAVSGGLISGLFLLFLWMNEHTPVESGLTKEMKELRRLQLFQLPRFQNLGPGSDQVRVERLYSVLFVIAVVLGFSLASWQPLVQASPVARARGNKVLRVGYPIGTVEFPHADHIKRIGEDKCGVCHHLHKPGDVGTPCTECHADLYLPTTIFDHLRHISRLGENSSCERCHPKGLPQSGATAVECSFCHKKDMMAKNEVVTKFNSTTAPGFRASAHKLCIACHRKEAKNPKLNKPDLFRCATCHRSPVNHGEAILEASLKDQQSTTLTDEKAPETTVEVPVTTDETPGAADETPVTPGQTPAVD